MWTFCLSLFFSWSVSLFLLSYSVCLGMWKCMYSLLQVNHLTFKLWVYCKQEHIYFIWKLIRYEILLLFIHWKWKYWYILADCKVNIPFNYCYLIKVVDVITLFHFTCFDWAVNRYCILIQVHYNIAKLAGDSGNSSFAVEKYRLAIK